MHRLNACNEFGVSNELLTLSLTVALRSASYVISSTISNRCTELNVMSLLYAPSQDHCTELHKLSEFLKASQTIARSAACRCTPTP